MKALVSAISEVAGILADVVLGERCYHCGFRVFNRDRIEHLKGRCME